ncbi:hypothetical protein OBBRIDRAFT_850603 [Obba rivulosa]|uniref:DUF6532 domain-containing protein n=1 Tax=Obba rivulosa TaxID=1052685 RepID=A0A8E2AN54_9APHY|nr:hypothetical protein OBBRIDRAFT_850603 [Obba rivulosa]
MNMISCHTRVSKGTMRIMMEVLGHMILSSYAPSRASQLSRAGTPLGATLDAEVTEPVNLPSSPGNNGDQVPSSSPLSSPLLRSTATARMISLVAAHIPQLPSTQHRAAEHHHSPSHTAVALSRPLGNQAALEGDPPHLKTPHFRDGQVPSGSPKASDYEPMVSRLILQAVYDFQVRVCTIDPFPEQDVQLRWAQDCWSTACTKAKIMYKIPSRILGLITERKSHARGTLRDKTRIAVITGYGLEQGLSSKAVKNNRALVVRLLGDRQAKQEKLFFWKDVEGPSGFAKHAVFTEVFRTEFFKSRTDAGVTYVDRFRPVSLPFLGLLFTVVECCLEEWRDGHLKKIKFSEADYRKKYEENLEILQEWSDMNPALVKQHRTQMYDKIRRDCGADPIEARVGLSDITRERLQAELAGHTGGSDSEVEDNQFGDA